MTICGTMSDTQEGRTIFVRSLSFDVDHDALYSFFAEFGPLEFAKVVKDPATQHSRGTGFVKFTNTSDAQQVLSDSCKPENASKFTLDNRQLILSLAVSREEAERLRGQQFRSDGLSKSKVAPVPLSASEDLRAKGRNLHLAKIGVIRAGTAAAEGMSKEDMAKREALLRAKKMKLRNPNIFISDVRLCVRNLPVSVTDDDLRRTCLRALGTKQWKRVTECRVMRNLEPGRQQFRSLGYAFISFTSHEDALKVLHSLNNNGELFPGLRRPIVEFSLENILALEKKRRRAERCALLQGKRGDLTEQAPKRSRPQTTKLSKHAKATLKSSRVLPKHLKHKKRHFRRTTASEKQHTKPKNRLSRKQIRLKKSHP